jgi:AcrR family transcriptional regulator
VTATAFPIPPLDPLPSGRHRLSREVVQRSQHGRLLFAIARVVSEKGYAAATVADIVDRASVSRSTFYAQFADKEACFLAAFNYGVEFVLDRMEAAWESLEPEADWRDRVRSDLTTFLDVLASEPAFARALHLDVLAAGPAALARRSEVLQMFSNRMRRINLVAREQEPSLPDLPLGVFLLHTGGMDELVRERLRSHGAGALPELAEPAIDATLALFGDRSVALAS